MSKKQSMGRLMTKAAIRAGFGRMINQMLDNLMDAFSVKAPHEEKPATKKATKVKTKKITAKT